MHGIQSIDVSVAAAVSGVKVKPLQLVALVCFVIAATLYVAGWSDGGVGLFVVGAIFEGLAFLGRLGSSGKDQPPAA